MANQKQTIKSKVLDFVESMGSARYTDIIRFIVDHNYGKGTYDSDKHEGLSWSWRRDKHVPANPWRGYYSGAFRKPYRRRDNTMAYPGYFFKDAGYGKLEKQEDGTYKTVR